MIGYSDRVFFCLFPCAEGVSNNYRINESETFDMTRLTPIIQTYRVGKQNPSILVLQSAMNNVGNEKTERGRQMRVSTVGDII